jgi:hypothetical protein
MTRRFNRNRWFGEWKSPLDIPFFIIILSKPISILLNISYKGVNTYVKADWSLNTVVIKMNVKIFNIHYVYIPLIIRFVRLIVFNLVTKRY